MLAIAPPHTTTTIVHHPPVVPRPNPNPPSANSSSSKGSVLRSLSPHRKAVSQQAKPVAVPPPLLHSVSASASLASAPSSAPAATSPQPTAVAPLQPAVDITSFPSQDLLRLLAQLLHKIATTNDKIYHASNHAASSRHPPSHTRSHSLEETPAQPPQPLHSTPLYASLTTASRSSVASPTSPLFFHARNVPTISIESYLLRILKYCPTTNEVFLSLLVYFDRMGLLGRAIEKEWQSVHEGMVDINESEAFAPPLVIDSYNIHRLIIAGVTVASKFFSDVFYTNSRYAKVGGLPTQELNKLELQFLLLNDFRLAIPPELLQEYLDALIANSNAMVSDPTPAAPADPSATPALELFGDSCYPLYKFNPHMPSMSSPIFTQPQLPPPVYSPTVPPNNSIDTETSSAASSVAPTPNSFATSSSLDGLPSSSSCSTITPSNFSRPVVDDTTATSSERTTPTKQKAEGDTWEMISDGPTPVADSSVGVSETGTEVGEEDDEDPTVRIPAKFTTPAADDEDEDGRRTPSRLHNHSQYSSYTNTEFGEDDPAYRRPESPAASLRYVDGQWNRSSDRRSDEDHEIADGDVTEDEVVYRGPRHIGRASASVGSS